MTILLDPPLSRAAFAEDRVNLVKCAAFGEKIPLTPRTPPTAPTYASSQTARLRTLTSRPLTRGRTIASRSVSNFSRIGCSATAMTELQRLRSIFSSSAPSPLPSPGSSWSSEARRTRRDCSFAPTGGQRPEADTPDSPAPLPIDGIRRARDRVDGFRSRRLSCFWSYL